MKKIFISAYRCNPFELHAAPGTFKCVEYLSERYDVTVAIPSFNIASIMAYYNSSNLKVPFSIIKINTPNFSKYISVIEEAFKFGYFIFDKKVFKYLKKKDEYRKYDLIYRLSPTSFRFPSKLYLFEKPFIVGNLNGGLQPPEILKEYFRKETIIYKLRFFDKYLLKSRFLLRYLYRAKLIIVGVSYTSDILPINLKPKIRFVPGMGIEKLDFSKKEEKNALFTFLYVGIFRRYKGGEILLRAFNQFIKKQNDANVQLILVGDGEEKKLFKRIVHENHIEHKVKFTGWLDSESVKKEMKSSHVFVFPSINEGLGNVFLEAMSVGLPIISTNYGGGGAVVKNGQGIKIEIDTFDKMVNDYAKAMEKMYNDQPFYNDSIIGSKQIAETYLWDNIKWEMYNVIDSLM